MKNCLIVDARLREIRPGACGVRFDAKPHRVSAPDVPSPVWEFSGRPEGGSDGRWWGTLIETLDWAGGYLPKEQLPPAPSGKP